MAETLLESRPVVSQSAPSLPVQPPAAAAEHRSRPLRVVTFVAILAGLIAVSWWLMTPGTNGTASAYHTQPLTVGQIRQTISATGPVQPVKTALVTSPQPGTIRRVEGSYNQVVKKDDLLAVLDRDGSEAQVAQAQKAVEGAENTVKALKAVEDIAKRELDIKVDEFKSKSIAEAIVIGYDETHKKAVAARVAADGQLATYREQLTGAKIGLAKTEIRAPMDGIVIECNAFIGQSVGTSLGAMLPSQLQMAASSAGASPQVLFKVVSDLSDLEVYANVGEADVGHIRLGQGAEFTVDAYPDEKFTGKVAQDRKAPVVFQNVVNYVAVISTKNRKAERTGEYMLRPGMTANVEIMSRDVPNALRIPNPALNFRPATEATPEPGLGHRWVWVLENGKPVPHKVRIGLADDDFTEIVESDLKEGDSVITDGPKSDAHSALKNLPVKAW